MTHLWGKIFVIIYDVLGIKVTVVTVVLEFKDNMKIRFHGFSTDLFFTSNFACVRHLKVRGGESLMQWKEPDLARGFS